MTETITLTAEQQAIVAEAIQLQLDSGGLDGKPMTDNAFARALGPKWGGGSKWNLIKNGKYADKLEDVGKFVFELQRGMNYFKSTARLGERFKGKRFVELPVFRAVMGAVEECQEKELSDVRRMIRYLAPTGGGKSLLSHELHLRFGATVLEARTGWRKSDYFMLLELVKKFGIGGYENGGFQPSQMTESLLDEWRKTAPVLVIDEAECFGKEVLDFLKLGINQTKAVIVVCGIPKAVASWQRRWPMETDQLRRRTHSTFELDELNSADVAALFGAMKGFAGVKLSDAEASLELVCRRANEFGSLALVDLVASSLEGQTANPTKVTAALNRHQAEMREVKA